MFAHYLDCQSGSWKSIFDDTSKTNPGYAKLPSGLIIQFGSTGNYSGSNTGTAPALIRFAIPFPTSCISATSSHMFGYGSASAAIWSAIKRCDKLSIEFGTSAPGRHWMAIGY